MATLKSRLSRAADRGLNKADEYVDDARNAKQRFERRYDRSEVGDHIEDLAENTGRNLRHAYESSMDKLDETSETARDLVHRNPLIAIAGAFVGGLLASSLLRR